MRRAPRDEASAHSLASVLRRHQLSSSGQRAESGGRFELSLQTSRGWGWAIRTGPEARSTGSGSWVQGRVTRAHTQEGSALGLNALWLPS